MKPNLVYAIVALAVIGAAALAVILFTPVTDEPLSSTRTRSTP